MENAFRRARPTPSNRLAHVSLVTPTVLRAPVVASTNVVAVHRVVQFLLMGAASRLAANLSSLTRLHPLVNPAIPAVPAAQEQDQVIVLPVPAPILF
jgi:hypothetical protein